MTAPRHLAGSGALAPPWLALGLLAATLVVGCTPRRAGEPALQEAPLAPVRPCYVPRADRFYFERDWLRIKGRELDALKFGNALWWLGEPSWNQQFDARDIYGEEQQIFGTLSQVSTPQPPADERQVRLLFLEERQEPQAPVLLGLRSSPRGGFFYVKALSRGRLRDPRGGSCWGPMQIREQRALTAAEARSAADCVKDLIEDRVRSEPWTLYPDDDDVDTHYLIEFRDTGYHGIAQYSRQVSNIDGITFDKFKRCVGRLSSLIRTSARLPQPQARK